MESLSSYARQFLRTDGKAECGEALRDCLRRFPLTRNPQTAIPRSTVGTVTEIYDYFRLLYARIGIPHCPKCGREIKKQTVDQMVDQIMQLPERTKIQLLAPVVQGQKGRRMQKLLDSSKQAADYVRVTD